MAEIAAVTAMAWFGGFFGVFLAVVFIWGVVTAAISGPDTDSRLAAIWRSRARDWGLWRTPTRRNWVWVAVGFAVLYLFGEAYTAVVAHGFSAEGDGTLTGWERTVDGQHGIGAQVGMILLAVVIAPMLEELGWRGYLIGGTRALLEKAGASRMVALVIPLVLSAALFGLSHTQYNLYGQVSVAVTGLVYGLVFMKTRNVLLSAVVHGASNSLWVLSILLY